MSLNLDSHLPQTVTQGVPKNESRIPRAEQTLSRWNVFAQKTRPREARAAF